MPMWPIAVNAARDGAGWESKMLLLTRTGAKREWLRAFRVGARSWRGSAGMCSNRGVL